MSSILNSIKKLLGIDAEYTHFDVDITMQINSVLAILTQVGVGPAEGFSITDETETWTDFLGEGQSFEPIKSYVYLRVKLLFDPPLTSSLIESMNKMISEFEWRTFVNFDNKVVYPTQENDIIYNG